MLKNKQINKQTLKSLIRFHSANKINIYNVQRGGEKENKNLKKNYITNENIKIIVFLESLLSESFPSLGVTVHRTSLGCPATLC